MGQVGDDVQALHPVPAQELGAHRVPAREQGDEEVAEGEVTLPAGLHVREGPVEHLPEADALLRLVGRVRGQPGQIVPVEEGHQLLPQGVEVHADVAEEAGGLVGVEHRQQQVLGGQVLVAPAGGLAQGRLQGHLQVELAHDRPLPESLGISRPPPCTSGGSPPRGRGPWSRRPWSRRYL